MLAAQTLDLGPVRRLRRIDAARADERLADERRDLGAALLEQRAERLGVVRADDDDLLDDLAAVTGLVAGDPGEGGPPRVHPVIAVLTRHDDPLGRLADDIPVAAHELGGGVDGVRAAGAEEHDRVVDRAQRGEPVGELDGRLGRIGTERGIGREPLDLVRDGLRDRAPTVAHRAVPERSGRVEVPTAIDGFDPDALPRAEHELGVLDDVHIGEAVPEPGSHGRSSPFESGVWPRGRWRPPRAQPCF